MGKCPFCGASKESLRIKQTDFIEVPSYQVCCLNCGARGPAYDQPEMAIEYWEEVASTDDWSMGDELSSNTSAEWLAEAESDA